MDESSSISFAPIRWQSKFVLRCIAHLACWKLTNFLFFCSANDEITHILHVSKELPEESSVDMQEDIQEDTQEESMAEVG